MGYKDTIINYPKRIMGKLQSKYHHLGSIENIHLFEEIPTGTIKDVNKFEKYLEFFKRKDGFKYEVFGREDFITCDYSDKRLVIKEEMKE